MTPGSRNHYYLARVSIILISVALITGTVGCAGGESYTLTITSTSGGSVAEPGEGTFTYDAGAVVNLVAAVEETDPAYDFVGWTGDVDTIANVNAATTTITMNDNYTINANFAVGIPVQDWYDLDAIRNDLAKSYCLMNDLDSTTAGYMELASPTANGGKGWQPIGTEDDWFTGTFDGQEYEICELFINRPDEIFIGLFAAVDEEGVVENTGVVDAIVTGYWGIGSLAGGNLGNVANCYATGNVTGYAYVGGLISSNGGTVSYCYSIGSVTGTGTLEYLGSTVGGLVAANSYGTVNHSYFAGDVTGANHTVGGLVGLNEIGSVTHSYATGSTTGSDAVGGLVGLNAGNVSESYSIGSVTGNGSVGGLVGRNVRNVTNCYSTGSVAGDDDVGGLVGRGRYDNVGNSFWDTQTSGQATSAGGVGKNTTEMQDITTFSYAIWNIIIVANPDARNLSCIWNIVDDETYPFLSWQS